MESRISERDWRSFDCAPVGRFAQDDTLGRLLVGAVVGELELDAIVAGAELIHDLLEDIAVLGDDADGISLDAGLGLELGVFDGGDDLLGIWRQCPV